MKNHPPSLKCVASPPRPSIPGLFLSLLCLLFLLHLHPFSIPCARPFRLILLLAGHGVTAERGEHFSRGRHLRNCRPRSPQLQENTDMTRSASRSFAARLR